MKKVPGRYSSTASSFAIMSEKKEAKWFLIRSRTLQDTRAVSLQNEDRGALEDAILGVELHQPIEIPAHDHLMPTLVDVADLGSVFMVCPAPLD